MSRQEDFIEAGIKYRFEHGTPNAIGGGAFTEMMREMNRAKPFEAGAEYGYKYAVDKVCTWLKQHAFDYLIRDMYDDWTYDDETMIRDIRKELEE